MLKKASTDLVAIARPGSTMDLTQAGEYLVHVVVQDRSGEAVFEARITMWVSPKKENSIRST